jgi:hypothetical protein
MAIGKPLVRSDLRKVLENAARETAPHGREATIGYLMWIAGSEGLPFDIALREAQGAFDKRNEERDWGSDR